MNLMQRCVGMVAAGLALLLTACGAGAQTYQLIDIGTLPNYGEETIPFAISETGRVVGRAVDVLGQERAFLWQPVASNGYPAGMTDLGAWNGQFEQKVVGYTSTHWTLDSFFENAGGQGDGLPILRALIWDGQNTPVQIPLLSQGTHNGSKAVSASGHAAGWSETGAQDSYGNPLAVAFVRQPSGTVSSLGTLQNYEHSEALGINYSGQSVGFAFNTDGAIYGRFSTIEASWDEQVAVRFANGGPIDLNTLVVQAGGWDLKRAWDINDEGVIVCEAESSQGRRGTVVLIPTTGDFNGDGQVNTNDAAGYLSAFDAQDKTADTLTDGVIDTFDGAEFMAAYTTGQQNSAPSFGSNSTAQPCDEVAFMMYVYVDLAIAACLDCTQWNLLRVMTS